jgi:hypothetical protein
VPLAERELAVHFAVRQHFTLAVDDLPDRDVAVLGVVAREVVGAVGLRLKTRPAS